MLIIPHLSFVIIASITKSFVDFNGVVPEKFDVVNMTHRVQVEYGNVGLDFKFIPREGFGWMNASYQVGLGYMDRGLRRALGAVMDPCQVFKGRALAVEKSQQNNNESIVTQPPDVTTRLVRPNSLRRV
ncbi:alpha,alpha-trehalase nth1 [Linnemannia schmuckeri]|uniref:Alpha,alpha-trehalase nth1 n=1 Tax=Linnemannia schmuckeri TaxID=64567 RepID=A0A9P5S2Q6_9FUNG|nr:alpha,alpha-trehalase nth1 [Linnemannia schmuckeri]